MSAPYQVQFQPYQFPLTFPLVTAHGHWTHRQGIIIQLTNDQGQTSSGEIAPLPWFGTETLAQATEFCQQLNGWITPEKIQDLGDYLPCCQFAFGSAEWGFADQADQTDKFQDLNYCQLLPTGKTALDYLEKVPTLSCQTVKWKIGVQKVPTEQAWFLQLLAKLPPNTHLRLDANGGLNLTEAKQWLALLDRQRQDSQTTIHIEYLEHPLPLHQLSDLFSLAQTFQTQIALDESVASVAQLQSLYDQQWPGIYILKGAIMGDPRRLHHWLTTHPIKAIFSSVFETAIARQQVLKLAQRWNLPYYAVGFSPSITNPLEPIKKATKN
jgi:O-succinylbenzoate synthase